MRMANKVLNRSQEVKSMDTPLKATQALTR